MTVEEYYAILKIEWEAVNKDSIEEIRQYNKMKRSLRQLIEEQDYELN